MKKIFIIILFFILAIGLYLYLANVYAYFIFGRIGLKAPTAQGFYMFNEKAAGGNLTYAAIGDSLTSGMGLNKYEESFPYLLAEDLSKSGKITLHNFSYPGYRTDDLIENLLEPAIAAKPKIITLLIGVNDIHGFYSAEKFKKNYQYILEQLSKKTEAEIYAISLPFIGGEAFLPPNNYYFESKTAEFNKIIEELAAAYGAKYIDIAEPTRAMFLKNGPYYAADKFHPSAVGQALWEKIIFDNITLGR
ncbi:MAG: SGNH/GDSL hydrolase family protein [Patescibacteria group bacterium]|nr:SGNH/GDSL hydrolase family protein [Patescibacteria group bacterium]